MSSNADKYLESLYFFRLSKYFIRSLREYSFALVATTAGQMVEELGGNGRKAESRAASERPRMDEAEAFELTVILFNTVDMATSTQEQNPTIEVNEAAVVSV